MPGQIDRQTNALYVSHRFNLRISLAASVDDGRVLSMVFEGVPATLSTRWLGAFGILPRTTHAPFLLLAHHMSQTPSETPDVPHIGLPRRLVGPLVSCQDAEIAMAGRRRRPLIRQASRLKVQGEAGAGAIDRVGRR